MPVADGLVAAFGGSSAVTGTFSSDMGACSEDAFAAG